MDKKQNIETAAAITIVALIIVVIVIFIFFGSVGMSIWDIRNNPENYVNKTITLTAFYIGTNDGFLLQKNFFGNTEKNRDIKINTNGARGS